MKKELNQMHNRIDAYHKQAQEAVGYNNFGSTEDNYLEGLETYLEAADNEAKLTEIGSAILDQTVIGNLIARLYAERGFEQYPECLSQPIVKPIIVVGLPRSGTTALHKLLASTPNTQSLEYWLGMFPMPRPPQKTWKNIREYQLVDKAMNEMHKLAPDLIKIHPYGTEIPDECNRIICHSFMSYALRVFPYTRTYGEWVIRQNPAKAYQRYKKVLQLIGYRNDSRWILKDPLHLPFIDILLQQFPDACIVHICREPGESMPSVSNAMHVFSEPYQKNINKKEYGQQTAEDYAYTMDRFMELRGQLNPAQFLDVSYTDLIADPVSLGKKIYSHFDIDIGIEGELNLEQWHQKNKRDKHGLHVYKAEDYGLTEKMLNERFAKFRQAYLL